MRNTPEPTEGKPAKTKWYLKAKTWVIATILGALTAAVTTFATGAAGKLFDLGAGRLSGPPFNISAVRVKDCPYSYIIPGTVEGASPAPGPNFDPDGVEAWAKRLGGVDGQQTQLEVTITGSSERRVVLHGIEVEIIDRGAPINGFQAGLACGDALQARWISIDLDRRPPIITQSVDDRNIVGNAPDVPMKHATFPYVVSQSQVEAFYIFASTEDCNCTWRAKLRWASGGKSGEYVIDDNGAPFRTHKTNGYSYYSFSDPPLAGS